jgi:hypothetical protein
MGNVANVVGVGCFAGTETLGRVFKKALENFILSKYEDIFWPAGRISNDENLRRFFKSVITCGAQNSAQDQQTANAVPTSAKITGFFLGLNNQSLDLIVFFLREGHQPARYTARLEKFSRLRKMRLH